MTTLIVNGPETYVEAHVHFYMVRLFIFSYY